MSKHPIILSIVLLLLAGLVGFSGHKLTGKDQKQDKVLEQINNSEKLARVQLMQITSLINEEAKSSDDANNLVRRWKSRYKIIPETLSSADVVQFIEGLTSNGFESSQIIIQATNRTEDFQFHEIVMEGTCSFDALYSLVWHLENDRDFLRVFDLDLNQVEVSKESTNPQDDEVIIQMVKFSMDIHAYFGGAEGLSAERELEHRVPVSLFPRSRPAHNSFKALITSELPPNSRNLVDVEKDELISVVGQRAIFKTKNGNRVLAVGEDVYLGNISEIDPVGGKVKARLNKLGVVNVITLQLGSEERYRQALGNDRQLAPIIQN